MGSKLIETLIDKCIIRIKIDNKSCEPNVPINIPIIPVSAKKVNCSIDNIRKMLCLFKPIN